jgi:hypothetical protein
VYEERLWPPTWAWLATTAFAATLGFAFWVPYGPTVGLAVGAAAVALTLVGLVGASGRVGLGQGVLRAGRARLPVSVVSAVTALDESAAHDLLGAGADARAFLFQRGWVRTAVRLDLDDPQDQVPYWFVSTRHPQDLAAAVEAARESG